MSFTAPSDIAPYKPDKNTCTVALISPPPIPPIPHVDQYNVTPTDGPPASAPFKFAVNAGTSLDLAKREAASQIAWAKFTVATCTQPLDAFTAQVAGIWFANNIRRPFYGF
jgi:hypothetical protein